MARHDKKSHANCHSLGLGAFVELHMPLMDVEELKIGDVLEGHVSLLFIAKHGNTILDIFASLCFLISWITVPKALTNGCEASSATRVVRISA